MDQLMHLQRMHKYELWANGRVNASLRTAALAVARSGAAPHTPALIKALQIWAHVQWSRRLWLSRLGVADPPSPEEGHFPARNLDDAIAECHDLDEQWAEYMGRISADQAAAVARYTSTEGVVWNTSVADILTHVVNHSTYHRGQIARLVAECGGEVAVTDYIAFARTKV